MRCPERHYRRHVLALLLHGLEDWRRFTRRPIDKFSVVFAVLLAILIFEKEVTLSHGIGIFLIAIGSLMIAIL